MELASKDLKWAYLVLRVATAMNLFGHGLVRVFGNYEGFRNWLNTTMAPSMIPGALIEISAWIIPPLELLLGLLLLVGFRVRETVLVASALIISLIFGSCLIQNWEIVGIQMIYVLIYFFLLAFRSYDFISIDSFKYTLKGDR